MAKVKPTEEASLQRYFNREISWLKFNERVLEEAENPENPLLERVKFLAIFESNLDEFYMVRVSGLIEQAEAGVLTRTPDGLSAQEQLDLIQDVALPLRQRAGALWESTLRPHLEKQNIVILPYSELSDARQTWADELFMREIFPLCTPLKLGPGENVPFISNRNINLVVEVKSPDQPNRLVRLKIPEIPRIIPIGRKRSEFILLEDLIQHNLDTLFPGVEISGSYVFRLIRDADFEIKELEAADLVSSIEETLRRRRFGDPVLLQLESRTPKEVRQALQHAHELTDDETFDLEGLLGLECLFQVASLDRPALRFPAHLSYRNPLLETSESIFEAIDNEDILLSHPYDSFRAVEKFVDSAAKDSTVAGIKQTLYRVGERSRIVESLLAAAELRKQVAVVVELKARFDESNNLEWARVLERAGAHVVYGFAELKTHAKLCLVVRRQGGTIKRYAHIGTGNYNPETARIYTDLGLFTDDLDITQDISELFNYLTGFNRQTEYRKLLVAPINLREGIIERIEREIEHHRAGRSAQICFKLNSLVDPEVIDALYAASQAGIRVDLIVRGICCLRPGVPGLSDHIHVRSIVGRFLEHNRIYAFANGGEPEMYIGSADLMRRNLDRRVEVLVPLESRKHKELVQRLILDSALQDNTNAWILDSEGQYERRGPLPGESPLNSQGFQTQHPLSEHSSPKEKASRKPL